MKRLILAGGGHAHLHVLKSLAQRAWPGVEVVLVTPHARQVYSGMLPGWIAGHYQLDECVAQLKPLVDAAGVRFVQDSVIGLDPRRRILRCAELGDIASRVDRPHAKSGVYAVRAGPVLTENLRRYLSGDGLIPYAPQRRSLYLLATGPRHAIASWNGWTTEGQWVWRWKDWIDRRFMKRYASTNFAPRRMTPQNTQSEFQPGRES